MIYFTADELFTELSKIARDNPEASVDIATYSMYLQITKGKDYSYHGNTPARQFIEDCNKDKLRMIVGLPYYMECKPLCNECANNYNQRVDRLVDTAHALHLNAKYHPLTHLKFYRIGDRIFTGGINLSSSDWVDIAMEITDPEEKKRLQEIFESTWRNAVDNVDELRFKDIEPWGYAKLQTIVTSPAHLYMYECLRNSMSSLEVVIDSANLDRLVDLCVKAYYKIEIEVTMGRLADVVLTLMIEGSSIEDVLNHTEKALSRLVVERVTNGGMYL